MCKDGWMLTPVIVLGYRFAVVPILIDTWFEMCKEDLLNDFILPDSFFATKAHAYINEKSTLTINCSSEIPAVFSVHVNHGGRL